MKYYRLLYENKKKLKEIKKLKKRLVKIKEYD